MTITGASKAIFLGAVVQPKTHQPIWVYRKPDSLRTVRIFVYEEGSPAFVGEGYLDGGDMGPEYLQAVKATGFPRVHTPAGLRERFRGGGYGTCLYTGVLLLASARAQGHIDIGRVPGTGQGICSSKGTRSSDAEAWWRAAAARGLTESEEMELEGEEEEEEETDEDVDLLDEITYRDRRGVEQKILSLIQDSWGGDGWPTNVNVRGDVVRTTTRESEGGFVEADYYTLTSAEKHKLVAIQDVIDGTDVTEATGSWVHDRDLSGQYHKDVILALNVSQEDPAMVGRIAQCAKTAGATDDEVSALMLRNKHGLDMLKGTMGLTNVDLFRMGTGHLIGGGQLLERPRTRVSATAATARTKNPGRRNLRHPPMFEPGYRRNPAPSSADQRVLDREADSLARRREKLGWDQVEDLP